MSEKKKVGVIGATGYAGAELVRLLLHHPDVTVAALSSVSFAGQQIEDIYPNLFGAIRMTLTDSETVIRQSDIVFAALPHGLSEKTARACVEQGKLFIDLGADFRLSDPAAYESWYGLSYQDPALHEKAVYSICELHRAAVRGKQIIANPGCYPTSIALGLAPALENGLCDTAGIVIDSKSGTTGAGRGLSLNSHFTEVNEAFAPYKVAAHRHTPEIEETLSKLAQKDVKVTFVPHLLPVNRGILSTIYLSLNDNVDETEIRRVYETYYRDERFVRVLPKGRVANIKYVTGSNYCDISLHPDPRTGRLVVVSAIDNMIKGAAGQAIQNMNIACGFAEHTAIDMLPYAF